MCGEGEKRPRIALRLCPDEREDLRKLRDVLKKEGKRDLAVRFQATELLLGGISLERTAKMCEGGTTTVKRWGDTIRPRACEL